MLYTSENKLTFFKTFREHTRSQENETEEMNRKHKQKWQTATLTWAEVLKIQIV
jgi:hypothetical protein